MVFDLCSSGTGMNMTSRILSLQNLHLEHCKLNISSRKMIVCWQITNILSNSKYISFLGYLLVLNFMSQDVLNRLCTDWSELSDSSTKDLAAIKSSYRT
jgi:hypothetical protein